MRRDLSARASRQLVGAAFGWLVLLLVGCSPPAGVEREPASSPSASSPSASFSSEGRGPAKPDRTAWRDAARLAELRELVGQTVTVAGQLDDVRFVRGGRAFLDLQGGLTATCSGEDADNFDSSEDLRRLEGAEVRITGLLQLYQGRLQLVFASPDDIAKVDLTADSETTASETAGASHKRPAIGNEPYLKQLSVDKWISPEGLQYFGRDPQGRTRVEHIMRHARDDPSRDGPHGVFDAQARPQVFGVIDEGWRLAESKKLSPQYERDRGVYTVPFGRRIGYLGGKVGRRKGQPPLSRLRIVFQRGSKRIVTAYPY